MKKEEEFEYKQEESDVFDSVKRPRIEIHIFSKKKNRWIWVDEVLADTGADFCMLPRYLGTFFVKDVTTGKYVEIKGVVPGARLIAYIHELISMEHTVYGVIWEYNQPNKNNSFNSCVENTLTLDCFLNLFSLDQMGMESLRANAKYLQISPCLLATLSSNSSANSLACSSVSLLFFNILSTTLNNNNTLSFSSTASLRN